MTAEIAIMNKSAVALATDSAVTIRNPLQPNDSPKIYDSVNKLFTLSKYHPVGIMVYGSAGLSGVPWEPIIKTFREELVDTEYGSIPEYGARFIDYLSGNRQLFPAKDQEFHFEVKIGGYFLWIVKEINTDVNKEFEDSGQIEERKIEELVTKRIDNHIAYLSKKNYLPNSNKQIAHELGVRYADAIERAINGAFGKLPLTDENRRKLNEIATLLYTRSVFPVGNSGMVIVGFGKKDIFPSLISYEIEVIVNDLPKYRENDRTYVTAQNSSVIYPFAQTETVLAFIRGIDPNYDLSIKTYLSELFKKLPGEFAKVIPMDDSEEKKALRKKLSECCDEMQEHFVSRMSDYQKERFVQPIIGVVESLPKSELADMVETLVSLTSFKQKVSLTSETVAGPIDVALISKGDGFIWVKRKHYFDKNFNYQFFQNYYRSGGNSDEEKQQEQ